MAIPERDTVYSNDDVNRTVYTRESSSTGWFVGIIVALALLAIGYLVFSANSGPSTTTTVNNTPAVESPVTDPNATTPMAPSTDTTPMTAAPEATPPATEAPPAAATPAPAVEAPPAAEPAPAPAQ